MRENRNIPEQERLPGRQPPSTGPTELLVLQATPFCNLDCDYCYLPNRDDRSRMDPAIIELALERLLEAQLVDRELTIVWHAGEPLVAGHDYYQAAIDRIASLAPAGITVHHSFQTNGVLIDDAWCDFFNRNRVRLGLSIDGPAELHDRHRRTRDGKGTHARVSRAVDRLRARNVEFHVIAVLTRESIGEPDLMFDYFSRIGIGYLCFNVEEIEAENSSSELLQNDCRGAYANFLTRFHELRKTRAPGLRVREIDGAINAVLGCDRKSGTAPAGTQESVPFRILNVSVDGDFGTFSPELLGTAHPSHGNFVIGNLATHGLLDILNEPHYRGIADSIAAGVERCRCECDYFALCGGGSPSNKLAENGSFDSTETEFCRLQKQVCVDIALNILEEGLEIVA